MTDTPSHFNAPLRRPVKPGADPSWAFVVLPRQESEKLPRRGRTTVEGTLNGHPFEAMLEPDGQLSHWLKVSQSLRDAAGVNVGDLVTVQLSPIESEPEPDVPPDLQAALSGAPAARAVWEDTTTLARVDWVHWIVSAKQAKTRAKRVRDACDKLASGKKRVCCFDPSGFYSKALRAPEAAE